MHKQTRLTCTAINGLLVYNQVFKDNVKPCLLKNSQNHCSYCDEHSFNAGNLMIEHFKSVNFFPHLEAEYSNLYASCFACNNRKRDASYPTMEPLRPDDAEYSFDKYFHFEPDTGKIILLDTNNLQAEATLTFLNLNNLDTRNARKNFVNDWIARKSRPSYSYRFIELPENNEK